MMKKQKALLLGATGLVGREVLDLLLQSDAYDQVTLLTRRTSKQTHPKLQEIVVDFASLGNVDKSHFQVDAVFSCLGTTKSKTPDTQQYKQIEISYPVYVAEQAMAQGAHSFHYVSALGASARSRFPYNQIKGTAEQQLQEVQAKWPQSYFVMYRPSFILGARGESRPLEGLAIFLSKGLDLFLRGPWRKLHSIHALTIAQAMVQRSLLSTQGYLILESDQIK